MTKSHKTGSSALRKEGNIKSTSMKAMVFCNTIANLRNQNLFATVLHFLAEGNNQSLTIIFKAASPLC
jgi:hypothetical protein